MAGRRWEIEEEEIVCRGYLNHKNDFRRHANEILKELEAHGYNDRDVEKVRAKLNDYDRIASGKLNSHIAPKSITVFRKLYTAQTKLLRGLKNYLMEVYGREGITDYDVPVNITIEKDYASISIGIDPNASQTNSFIVRDIDRRLGPNFVDLLMNLLMQDGRDNADIYNSVCMDRRVFSKLIQGQSVSKRNILKLAIALKLDLETTKELMASAGFALDTSKKIDVVAMYAIENEIYNLYEIEEALEECGEPSLFFID